MLREALPSARLHSHKLPRSACRVDEANTMSDVWMWSVESFCAVLGNEGQQAAGGIGLIFMLALLYVSMLYAAAGVLDLTAAGKSQLLNSNVR